MLKLMVKLVAPPKFIAGKDETTLLSVVVTLSAPLQGTSAFIFSVLLCNTFEDETTLSSVVVTFLPLPPQATSDFIFFSVQPFNTSELTFLSFSPTRFYERTPLVVECLVCSIISCLSTLLSKRWIVAVALREWLVKWPRMPAFSHNCFTAWPSIFWPTARG